MRQTDASALGRQAIGCQPIHVSVHSCLACVCESEYVSVYAAGADGREGDIVSGPQGARL